MTERQQAFRELISDILSQVNKIKKKKISAFVNKHGKQEDVEQTNQASMD